MKITIHEEKNSHFTFHGEKKGRSRVTKIPFTTLCIWRKTITVTEWQTCSRANAINMRIAGRSLHYRTALEGRSTLYQEQQKSCRAQAQIVKEGFAERFGFASEVHNLYRGSPSQGLCKESPSYRRSRKNVVPPPSCCLPPSQARKGPRCLWLLG